MSENQQQKLNLILCACLAIIDLCIIVGLVFLFLLSKQPLQLHYATLPIDIHNSLRVEFNQPIKGDYISRLEPNVPGFWQSEKTILGTTALFYVPDHPLQPGKSYQIHVENISSLFGTNHTRSNMVVTLTTEQAPEVIQVSPRNNSQDNRIQSKIIVKLNRRNRSVRQLRIQTTPQIQLTSQTPNSTDDQTFIWEPIQGLRQDSSYKLIIIDESMTGTDQILYSGQFSTVPTPIISSATQGDHIDPKANITITFDQPMDESQRIPFDFAGNGNWLNSVTYQFKPKELKLDDHYEYIVPSNIRTARGGLLQHDNTFSITTLGAVKVSSITPNSSLVSVTSVVQVVFDQSVDKTSAQNNFHLTPAINGSFSWKSNTMTFQPKSLDKQTEYRVTVESGVASLMGLPSNQTFNQSFTTELPSILVKTPFYKQPYSLSCEATALKMVLARLGITSDEMTLVQDMGYNPRPRNMTDNTWDDPNQMFVGDINGIFGKTGFGAYGEPIVRAAEAHGRKAKRYTPVTANWVAEQVYAGETPLIWGVNPSGRNDSWYANGSLVIGPVGEHVIVITGVTGRADRPIEFIVNDPLVGIVVWQKDRLEAFMNHFGINQAVVVN
jgi:uncharacterized protein YvpB